MKRIAILCLMLLAFIGSFSAFASSQEDITLNVDNTIQAKQAFDLEINNASTSLIIYLPKNITYAPTVENASTAFSVEENGDQLMITPNQESTAPSKINIPLVAEKSGDYSISAESGYGSRSSVDFTVEPDTEETTQAVVDKTETADQSLESVAPTNASSLAENSNRLQLKAEQDGWIEQSTFQASMIDVDPNTTLYYQFGNKPLQGTTVSLDDIPYISPGAYIYDKIADRAIYALYGQENTGTQTSHIDILIGDEPNSTSIFTNNNEHALSWSNLHYYTKTDPNGLMAQRLSFDFVITLNEVSYNFNMSIEMHGYTNGYVSITQKLTNLGDEEVENIVTGNRSDTKLDGDDNVPIKFIGQNEGLYIETRDTKYRLFYMFNRANSFPNWKGDYFTNSYVISSTPNGGTDKVIHFQYPTSTGQEFENAASGTNAFYINKKDSAIFFKTQPFSLKPNESHTSEYTLTLQSSPPKMIGMLDNLENEAVYYGGDLEFSGTWNDLNSDYVDLYYQIDNQDAVLFGDDIMNTTKGSSTSWTQAISEEAILNGHAFTPGTKHTITFYVIDDEEYTSNLVTFDFTETYPTVTAKYVDSSGETVAPDEIVTGAPGTDYQTTAKEIEGYAISSIDGAAQGTFTTENKTVTYIYDQLDYSLTGQVLAKQGDSYAEVTTAAPGDTVRYSYTFNTPYTVDQGYYYDTATFTLDQVDSNITEINNIQITDAAGNIVGDGSFSTTDRTLTANLTSKNTERSEKLTLTFDAKISPAAEIGATIDQSATTHGSFTSSNTFSADSNAVHLNIVSGELKFISAPDTLSFGSHPISNSETTYYGEADEALAVSDARGAGSSWKLLLQLQTPLHGATSQDDLTAYLSYYHDDQAYPLSTTASIEVTNVQTKDASPVVISSDWAKGQEGFHLTLPGSRPLTDSYECTAGWTLQSAP